MKIFTFAGKIHYEEVTVSPETIRHPISFLKNAKEELKTFFEFELAPYPNF